MFGTTAQPTRLISFRKTVSQNFTQTASITKRRLLAWTSPQHRRTTNLLLLTAIAFGATLFQPATVRAGTGTFRDGKFNFCVSVRFNATEAQLQIIRTAFEDASQVLSDVTDGHHRFGTINIVNNSGASEDAEFWVPSTGGRAVGTYGHFGKKGQHAILYGILTPAAGPDIEAWVIADRAYTIAHEFGHHAYGLYDEYVNGRGQSGANISCPPPPAAGCNPDLNYCLMDWFSQRGGAGCPTPTSPTTPRVHTMNEFCVSSNHDKPNASGVGGGETAQSVHGRKSCWATISGHKKEAWRIPAPTLPASAPPTSSPTPIFGNSCGKPKVAILIDRSGSMSTDNRLSFAKLGAEQFINSFANGSLAIVSFSGSPAVSFPVTEITNDTTRNNAKAAVNALIADGPTNIGDGLLAALAQLNSQGDCASCEKTIILLSDGEHNTGTSPESVVAQLNSAGVKLITSVVGSSISLSGETSLQNITSQTNGEYYRVSTAADATGGSFPGYSASGLVGLFMRLGSDMKGDALLKQERQVLTSGQVKDVPVFVETGAATAAFAVTIADHVDNVMVSLRSPAGVIYTGASSPNVEFTTNSNSRLFRVNSPQEGTWTMTLSAGTIRTGKIEVLSFGKHDGVRLHAWVDQENVLSVDSVQVYASPTFEGERVTGASVTGTVIRPDGSKVPINMFDDGLDSSGDFEPNDGIYSALFNSYSSDGTYSFELVVQSSNGSAYAGEPLNPDAPSNVRPLPPFVRAASTTATVSGLAQGDTVWFDDALPSGATPFGDGESWHWVDANPAAFSGGAAHQSRNFAQLQAVHQHYFDSASAKLPVNAGDKLFTYVFLDINSMPREIMLQWHDGTNWEHRAYWGQNNIGFGIEGTNSRRYMGPIPPAGQWVRLEVPASVVGLEAGIVSGMAFTLDGGRATWDLAGKTIEGAPPPPTTPPGDFVWVEDSIPAGAIPAVQDDHWEWVSSSPSPFSGQSSHRSFLATQTGTGRFRHHSFTAASTPMLVNPGDVLFTYVYLDPTFTPEEIVLQWHDGDSWEHRAFWGQDLVGGIGTLGTESRRYAGPRPPAGQWVRLEIPASHVGLEGKTVHGMAFGYYKQNDRARVSWDKSGKAAAALGTPVRLQPLVNLWRVYGTGGAGYYRLTNSDVLSWDETLAGHLGFVDPKQAAGTVPMHVFRSLQDNNAKYFYTRDRNGPQPPWLYLGIAFYVFPDSSTPGTVPLYLFHDNIGYFFTTNYSEGNGKVFDYIAAYVYGSNQAPPLVVVTSPLRKTILTTPANVLIEASASDPDGNVVNVEFFKNGTKIGEDNIAPYSFNWNNVTAGGTYRISAKATDNEGLVASDYVDLIVNSPPVVTIANPSDGAVFQSPANIQLSAFASDVDGSITKVEFFQGINLIGSATAAPFAITWNGVPAGNYTLTARATDDKGASSISSTVGITVNNNASVRTNVALASNGASASASSSYSGFAASGAINGDRKGLGAWQDGYWSTGSSGFPAWLEVQFNGAKAINEIDVFTGQDNYASPVEPTEPMTFTAYGLIGYDVQYWNGSAWVTVPSGSVSENNKVWRKIIFSEITTTKIRVLTNASPDGYSRLTELEAWSPSAQPPPINFALAVNGATATASSSYAGFAASGAINGDRKGLGAFQNGYWSTAQAGYPGWLEVSFNGAKTISEIDVFMGQDNYNNPSEPTESMTFTLYGSSAFDVQYWNGSSWANIPNGAVTGNDRIWRKFTFAPITTDRIRVMSYATPDGYSRLTELEAWGIAGSPVTNVGLASNGTVASASSIYGAGYPASAVNNGDRKGINAGSGGNWNDAAPANTFPDSVELAFNGSKTISEVDVFTLQDNWGNPSEPTEGMMFSLYGLTGYDVQYWNGSNWVTVPGGNITGNNKVWRKLTFAPITTTKIRVLTNSSPDGWSRLTEIEAWGYGSQ